ncbi:MAG TPA: DUF4386 domain-containing protein [Gemmatimonadales bacterium]|jgi:hypothetical protein|nr:DUF4386 domain-containing protein [Gemmatimonadales bacterium]
MNPRKRTARLAGLLLLLGGITSPFSLIYLPKKLIVAGDATATANNVRAFEKVLRIAITCDLIGVVLFTLGVLSLYRLFKDVDNQQALYMIVLWVVTVPITFINELNRIGALILVSGASFLSAFTSGQTDALVMLLLKVFGQGTIVNQIFWGLWLVPYGILVYKSRFIPRVLGLPLIIAGCAYVSASVTELLSPHYARLVTGWLLMLGIGELPILIWLLVKGVRDQSTAEVP